MLSFFKNKDVLLDEFSFLEADMHAHFIPGIDDGAANLSESFRLIDGLIALGYKKLIGTPHIMADIHKNTPETIKAGFDRLKSAMEEKNYSIPIDYAAEYMMDEQFEEKINAGPLLTFGNRNVLIETMFFGLPHNIKEILFTLEMKGYKPILAHPERYHYLDDKLEVLDIFIERGVMLQANLLSFTGYYGRREKEMAETLLFRNMLSFLGTDIHHLRHLRALQKFSVSKKVADKIMEVQFKNKSLMASF